MDSQHRLRTEKPRASPTALRGQHATGKLTPGLTQSLWADPALLAQVAHVLLDTNFEPSLHEDICAAVGLDLETAETRTAGISQRQGRDPQFRRDLLTAYEYQCAFCGYDGLLQGYRVGLEAAHVRWLTHDGPNTIDNGLCLCSLHHKLFDKGVLGITDRHRVTVSAQFIGRSQAARQLVLSLSNQPVRRPLTGFSAVAKSHADWHASQVFRAPARSGRQRQTPGGRG